MADDTIKPIGASLYEIFYAKKENPPAALPSPEGVGIIADQEDSPSTITIRQMLEGVKDSKGNFYISPNQSPEELKQEQEQKEAVRRQYEGTDQWMRAPNGEPTNLTEDQWLSVRTPNFKAWFGDWEYIANAYPSVTAKERIEVKEILETLRNKDLVSRDENIIARISKEGRSKLVSDAALHKSQKNGFSIEEHYTAVANIKKLFEHSVRSRVKEDKNKEIEALENFSTPIMFESGIAIATLSVKVTKEAKTGRSIYSIELMELKKSGGTIPSQIQKTASDTPDLYILNISKIAEKVNATSKIVDENGEPLVVYHGSDADFDVFDVSKSRANMDIQGSFFSPWKLDAQGYGENVRAFFLNIKNPANSGKGYKALNAYKGENGAGIKARDLLVKQGFDGLNNDDEEFIAFEPTQIKSATGNNGHFDPEDANIYHQEGGDQGGKSVLDTVYNSLVKQYETGDEKTKEKIWEKLSEMVEKAAQNAGFFNAIPDQTVAYKIRTGKAPQKTIKVYKVFTMSPDGSPTALFIGGTEKLPQGVWLDAVSGFHFTAENGKEYVPSTKNPFSKGNKTGASIKIPNDKVRQELIRRNFLPKGSEAEKITALAYRPGWHAGTMPFFPQGGTKPPKNIKSAYENIHRYNQVIFECELAADIDYTPEAEAQPKARTKKGTLNTKNADLQYMPKNGFYYYATNPMTHGHPELGLWAISGSLKINRALTQDECDKILRDNNLAIQEWEQGELNLADLGYMGEQKDAARKTLAPITYDDEGNIIPLSRRFNRSIDDVRYQRGANNKGSYEQSKAIVRLFETADQSTFMHEMSHHYLTQIELLAREFPESEAAKQYETIMAWAGYKKGQAKEYKGTASAGEFMNREKKILAAEKKGNQEELQRLYSEWAQERFARGFEEYLRHGEAPTKTLKKIFRRFKRWLSDIYKKVTGAGVRATAEVEAIMERMIATDAEIEALGAIRRAKRITAADPSLTNEQTSAMMAKWEEEAKEEAKEKLLKDLIIEYQKKDIDAHMAEYKREKEAEFSNKKAFQAEAVAKDQGENAVVEMGFYSSLEDYRDALKEAGGGWDKAMKKALEREERRYIKKMDIPEGIHARAEEALATGEYSARLTALEEEILNRRASRYQKISVRLSDAFKAIEESDGNPRGLFKAVANLKYAAPWGNEEAEQIKTMLDDVKAMQKKEGEEREKIHKSVIDRAMKLKEGTLEKSEWLKGIVGSAVGKMAVYRRYAADKLSRMSAKDATDTRHWMRKARAAANESLRALAKTMGKESEKSLIAARNAKARQNTFEAMALESFYLARELRSIEGRFARRQKTIANDKQGRIDINCKYFINHLLYVYGYANQDAARPSGTLARDIHSLIQEFKDDQKGSIGDIPFDFNIPAWLLSAAESEGTIKNYKYLTMDQLNDLKIFIETLYTMGRNRNRLITLDMDVDDAIKEMVQTYERRTVNNDGKHTIHEATASLLKVETVLKVLGGADGAFIKYLYNPLFDGTDKETGMQHKAAVELREIYNEYATAKERAALSKDKLKDKEGKTLTLPDGTELTKESVLALALNWGNKGNRDRVLKGFQSTVPEIEAIFQQTMSEKDWLFVQKLWDYIGQFADGVNDVVERTTGSPMRRVSPDAFKIQTHDEKVIDLRGGYYPIKYDADRSSKASDMEIEETAQTMMGHQVFGTGLGSTKSRAQGAPKDRPIRLTLDVVQEHTTQQIHIITMRLPCRDVYKLLQRKEMEMMITETFGASVYKNIKNWCENTWMAERSTAEWFSRRAEKWRRNTVASIMGYRTTTAILNFANIVPMADKIGPVNAISAILQYIRNHKKIRDFVLVIRRVGGLENGANTSA